MSASFVKFITYNKDRLIQGMILTENNYLAKNRLTPRFHTDFDPYEYIDPTVLGYCNYICKSYRLVEGMSNSPTHCTTLIIDDFTFMRDEDYRYYLCYNSKLYQMYGVITADTRPITISSVELSILGLMYTIVIIRFDYYCYIVDGDEHYEYILIQRIDKHIDSSFLHRLRRFHNDIDFHFQ